MAPDPARPRVGQLERWVYPWLLASATIVARIFVGSRPIDDAYITFRYARNLAGGLGFVYNPGEHVLGTTTPLFALLLAGASSIFGQIDLVAFVVAMACDSITAILIYKIVREFGYPVAGVVGGLLFAFSVGSLQFSSGAMETSLFLMLLMLGTWFFTQMRFRLAGFVAGLAVLTRPEGLILLALLFGLAIVWRRRAAWEILWVSAAVIAPWVIFSWLYFGTPLPQSVSAKASSYSFPPLAAVKSLLGLGQQFVFDLERVRGKVSERFDLFIKFTLLALQAFFVVILYRKRKVEWSLLILFPLAYLGAYSVANPVIFDWYAMPPVPFVICVSLVALAEITNALVSSSRVRPILRLIGPWAGPVAVLLALFGGSLELVDVKRDLVAVDREAAYFRVAQRLLPVLHEGDSVACVEIGALGYALPSARILDSQGLVSPEAVPYRKQMLEKYPPRDPGSALRVGAWIPPQLVADLRPDFIVTAEQFAEILPDDPAFQRDYVLVLAEPTEIFSSKQVLVFQRVSRALR